MFQKLEIGKPFKLMANYEKNIGIEGAIMESHEEGFFSLSIYLPDITNAEKDMLREGEIKFRVITDDEKGYVLTIMKIGNLIFEISFDPTLYKDIRNNIEVLTSGNAFYLFGVDSNTNILETIRLIVVPKKLMDIWKKNWSIMLDNKDNGYFNWVQRWTRYPINTMWEFGSYVGKLAYGNYMSFEDMEKMMSKIFDNIDYAMNNEIKEKEGTKLYECAGCHEHAELLERVKFELSEEEKKKEMENEFCMPHIDFYRFRWSFLCKKCSTMTNVITEIDRY